MTRIIVGVDGSTRSEDAVAFARGIAEASGAQITLACAYPYEDHPSRATNGEYRDYLNDDAQATLDRMKDGLEGVEDVVTAAIADLSPARALQELAVRDSAALVVLGSTHRGTLGRVVAGTTAERLLHGAPCSVAVVPDGFRTHADTPIKTIAVGHDGSKEAEAALSAAVMTSQALGAALRVVHVFSATESGMPALVSWPGYVTPPEVFQRFAHESLEKAMAAMPEHVDAEPVFVTGDAVNELVDQSERADLLFLGSRGYGPHRAVLLGSVSGHVVREAGCPVVVVPRGVEAPLESLFGVTAAGATSG